MKKYKVDYVITNKGQLELYIDDVKDIKAVFKKLPLDLVAKGIKESVCTVVSATETNVYAN